MKKSPKRTPQRNPEKETTQPNKFNSTSTMYINDTLNSPNVDELLRCLAMRVQQHIIKGVNQPFDRNEEIFFEVFDERRLPIVKGANLAVIPGVPEIYDFIFKIFETERLSHECGILFMAYIERIMETSGIRLFPYSWRRVVLSALILASKVWEDQAVWNVDFLSVFPSVKVGDLAQLEKKILSLLRFDVSLAAKDYAQLYFDLRDMSGQGFPLKPLDKDGKARLEMRTKLSDDWTKMASQSSNPGIKRSQSAEWAPPKTPNAVLN
jgi:hypothetical protein